MFMKSTSEESGGLRYNFFLVCRMMDPLFAKADSLHPMSPNNLTAFYSNLATTNSRWLNHEALNNAPTICVINQNTPTKFHPPHQYLPNSNVFVGRQQKKYQCPSPKYSGISGFLSNRIQQ